jgi:signal transduction histidine kinase
MICATEQRLRVGCAARELNHETPMPPVRDRRPRDDSGAEGHLAAALAHAVRNPLNGASLHLSIVERELARSPAPRGSAAEALGVVRSELQRISSFVTDFLEFARPAPLVCASTDLILLVARAVDGVRPAARARGVALRFEPSSPEVVADVDGERLEHAVVELLENAVEAAPGDGHAVARVGCADRQATIEVEDDGVGVPADAPQIFDAFHTTKPAGTGLGLSIVRRIVEDHGGEVAYESVPGRTVFRVRLPVSRSAG